MGGWQRRVLGEHLREVFYALGDAILCAAGALTGLDTEEKPRWQRKMEGIKHPHRQPHTLPLLSLRVKYDAKPKAHQPSDIDKTTRLTLRFYGDA